MAAGCRLKSIPPVDALPLALDLIHERHEAQPRRNGLARAPAQDCGSTPHRFLLPSPGHIALINGLARIVVANGAMMARRVLIREAARQFERLWP
jgi:hypothetical protein